MKAFSRRWLAVLVIVAWHAATAPGRGAEDVMPLANAGFEQGTEHWELRDTASGTMQTTPEAALSGKLGLRATGSEAKPGPSIASERFPVQEGRAYRLTFQARAVSGRNGCGVYLRYFDAAGKVLNDKPWPDDVDVCVPNAPSEKGWMPYKLESLLPEGAVSGCVRIYAYAPGTLDLDDLRLVTYEPEIAPPWPPTYKLTAEDKSRLTAADVVGPDGLVYPDWSQAGVPDGIPTVPTVIKPEEFLASLGNDLSAPLEKAITRAAAVGGGAIELPEGTFYLDRSVFLRQSHIVLRGQGPDRTRLVFRDHIPYGTIRFFNWADAGQNVGVGTTIEFQANPKDLERLEVICAGKILAADSRKMHWGNTYAIRMEGDDLLQKLGAGKHVVEAVATYGNGEQFARSFELTMSTAKIAAPTATFNAALVVQGAGLRGNPRILLARDGRRGDRTVLLADASSLHPGDQLQFVAPATARWNALVGNHCPWGIFRAGVFDVVTVEGNAVTLSQPLRIEFPMVDGAYVQKMATISGCGIENLTLEQEVITKDPQGPKNPFTLSAPIEDLWTNGITFSYARGCWARNVRVVHAGRNPLYLPNCKFCEVRDCEFDDSLFKGGGGTAYIGLETAFDCLMDSVTTRQMRHAPDFQWGSSGNVVRNSRFYNSDCQFHAGWTNENLLEGNLITSSDEDMANGGYGNGIFSSGPASTEHGPQGPRNVIYHNDVAAPLNGIMMVGGNENWMILYNRICSGKGRAIVGREEVFDTVIRGNTFILAQPDSPAISFEAPNCTGNELTDNQFYGAGSQIVGFRGRIGKLARDVGNESHPFTVTEAALPTPEVSSIYLWEKEHARAR